MSGRTRIKASDRRKQFLKYVTEGKVDDDYYVIDKGDGKTIQIRRRKCKNYVSIACQTDT